MVKNMVTVGEKLVLETMIQTVNEIGAYDFFKRMGIENALIESGFTKEIVNGKRVTGQEVNNQNRVYQKEDSDVVYVIVDSPETGVYMPIMLDKDIYEKLNGKMIFINHGNKKLSGARPTIKLKDNLGITHSVKLHRFVMGSQFDDDLLTVDHVNHCVSSCLKENLRMVTRRQNECNKKFRAHIIPNKNKFDIRVQIDTSEKRNLMKRLEVLGFVFEKIEDTVDVFQCISPDLCSKDMLYHYINRVETGFFGEFKYRACEDFEHAVSTYLYLLQKMGSITYDQLLNYNRVVVEQIYGKKYLDYYRLSAA